MTRGGDLITGQFEHDRFYPSAARERAILAAKAPEVPEKRAGYVVAFFQKLGDEDLFKLPGVAETIDWAQA
jgi:hypothetical protein